MSKSIKPHPCFYNNDYTYLVDLNTKEKYITSITKHYAARYYKEGIEDMIPKRWSKEVHHCHFEALNDIHHWEEDKIDFFKVGMNAVTEGNVYSDLRTKSVVCVVVKKKWGYSFLTSIVVRRFDDKEYEFSYADLPRLTLNDVEDIYLLQVQDKLHHLPLEFVKYFNNALLMFIRRTLSEVKKFCDGTLVKIQENLIDMLGSGNKRLKGRDWTDYDVKSSKEMLKKIDEILKHREQLRRLEEYVGGRPKTIDPRTLIRPIYAMTNLAAEKVWVSKVLVPAVPYVILKVIKGFIRVCLDLMEYEEQDVCYMITFMVTAEVDIKARWHADISFETDNCVAKPERKEEVFHKEINNTISYLAPLVKRLLLSIVPKELVLFEQKVSTALYRVSTALYKVSTAQTCDSTVKE
ncbi:hypothetical protein Tco_1056031 [Tanacetum coccineum]|uniref:Uncharacterized protein n=1 Tax=Tanacetum coccineum TaxID=301880 RepID=A0ABQ5H2K1_9ASTR